MEFEHFLKNQFKIQKMKYYMTLKAGNGYEICRKIQKILHEIIKSSHLSISKTLEPLIP